MSKSEILWEPTAAAVESSNLTAYTDWLRAKRGVDVTTYPDLWQWSVDDLEVLAGCGLRISDAIALRRRDFLFAADRHPPGSRQGSDHAAQVEARPPRGAAVAVVRRES